MAARIEGLAILFCPLQHEITHAARYGDALANAEPWARKAADIFALSALDEGVRALRVGGQSRNGSAASGGCYRKMEHYFPNVPGLGNVAVSRHAQDRMRQDGITESTFRDALMEGETIPDGHDVIWREKHGIRIVILRRPEPFAGAMLVKTVYRVEGPAQARRG